MAKLATAPFAARQRQLWRAWATEGTSVLGSRSVRHGTRHHAKKIRQQKRLVGLVRDPAYRRGWHGHPVDERMDCPFLGRWSGNARPGLYFSRHFSRRFVKLALP